MSLSGYQSDVRLNIADIAGDGNVPSENSLGGYGVTTAKEDNSYELKLEPSLTKTYRAGLPLHIRFHRGNTDAATLNIDGQGAVPIKKFNGGMLAALDSGDLKTDVVYTLVFDGTCFQVLTGILPVGISSNNAEVRSIADEQIDLNSVFYANTQNKYLIVNGNLIVCSDIRLRKVGGAGVFGPNGTSGTVLKLPVPEGISGFISWTALSTENNPFFCRLSGLGVVNIRGELISETDELVLNFPSYIARMPVEFPETPVFNPPQP